MLRPVLLTTSILALPLAASAQPVTGPGVREPQNRRVEIIIR